ncbi:MAG: acetyl-CoA synthetase, partial [Prevotella sp.]|nr:acetyl-CoA synthetase [Prevotella sp.]
MNSILEKYIGSQEFSSYDDFMEQFHVDVPDDFNFGYDVIDAWAEAMPEKEALLWVNDQGEM